VIPAGLAQMPESPVGFPVQLLPWSWGPKQSGEQVLLRRVVSYCPRTFHFLYSFLRWLNGAVCFSR
jgi:hypothetical protein